MAVVAALAVGATVVLAQNAAVIAAAQGGHEGVRRRGQGAGRHEQGRCAVRAAQGAGVAQDASRRRPSRPRACSRTTTKTGETDALPAAFEKKADLFAHFDKLAADAKAAEAAIKDEATFKAEWPKVSSNCGGCHKEYRKPQAK